MAISYLEASTGAYISAAESSVKGIRCGIPFCGGWALFLFYGVRAMASCNYIPQIMLNHALYYKKP